MGKDKRRYRIISRGLRSVAPALAFLVLGFHPLGAQVNLLPVFQFNRLTTADGLPTNEICSYVVTDPQGLIWIGTENGLARYDGYTCRVYRHKAGDSGSLPANSAMELLVDSRGLLWIGTDLHGLSIYDRSNDRILNFRPQGKDSVLRGLKPEHGDNHRTCTGRRHDRFNEIGTSCLTIRTQKSMLHPHIPVPRTET